MEPDIFFCYGNWQLWQTCCTFVLGSSTCLVINFAHYAHFLKTCGGEYLFEIETFSSFVNLPVNVIISSHIHIGVLVWKYWYSSSVNVDSQDKYVLAHLHWGILYGK